MDLKTEERFPITDAVLEAFMATPAGLVHSPVHLQAPAQAIVQAWIEGLTDRELLELRFATNHHWLTSMRTQLLKFAAVPE